MIGGSSEAFPCPHGVRHSLRGRVDSLAKGWSAIVAARLASGWLRARAGCGSSGPPHTRRSVRKEMTACTLTTRRSPH